MCFSMLKQIKFDSNKIRSDPRQGEGSSESESSREFELSARLGSARPSSGWPWKVSSCTGAQACITAAWAVDSEGSWATLGRRSAARRSSCAAQPADPRASAACRRSASSPARSSAPDRPSPATASSGHDPGSARRAASYSAGEISRTAVVTCGRGGGELSRVHQLRAIFKGCGSSSWQYVHVQQWHLHGQSSKRMQPPSRALCAALIQQRERGAVGVMRGVTLTTRPCSS